MNDDRLEALRQAGLSVDQFSPAQRRVLAQLTEDERAVLLAFLARVGASGAEIGGNDLGLII